MNTNKIIVHGVSHTHFFNSTQKALEEFQGSPIHKMAKIRQFMATMFQLSENSIPSIFTTIALPDTTNTEPTVTPEIDDTQLIAALAKLEFLQRWNDDSEYIDRNFEVRAHDDDAIDKDISVDFRVSFCSQEKYAVVIVGKNYGSGANGETEFDLRDVPNLEKLTLELPDFITKAEVWDAHHELMRIYDAIVTNKELNALFIQKEKTITAMIDGIEIECKSIPVSTNENYTQHIDDMPFLSRTKSEIRKQLLTYPRFINGSIEDLEKAVDNIQSSELKAEQKDKPLSADEMFDENDAHEAMESFDNAMAKIQLEKGTGIKVAEKESLELMPTGVYIITTLNYENNDTGTGMVLDKDDIDNITCLAQEQLNGKLKDAFTAAFPDNDGTVRDVLNFSMVDEKICDLADEDANEAREIERTLKQMDAHQIRDWLLENFDIDELIDNMLNELTMGYVEIKWELVNL